MLWTEPKYILLKHGDYKMAKDCKIKDIDKEWFWEYAKNRYLAEVWKMLINSGHWKCTETIFCEI